MMHWLSPTTRAPSDFRLMIIKVLVSWWYGISHHPFFPLNLETTR